MVILYLLFISILAIFLFFLGMYISSIAYFSNFTFGIFLFDLILLINLVILFILPFIKIKLSNKIKLFFISIICLVLSFMIPDVIKTLEYQDCIDTGVCQENIIY